MFTLESLQNKIKKKDWLAGLTYSFTFFIIASLITVVIFIFIRSLPFLKSEGLSFLFKENWVPSEKQFGIWNFILSTFWTILFTFFIVIFFNIFVSLFISKFLPHKIKNFFIFFTQFFSGIPSICFGTFGAYVFLDLFQKAGIAYPHSMMTVILILSIMILPTTIILTVNALENVSKKYELSAYALGVNRVNVSFEIIKKICSKTIWVILFLGFCRAIGEVTAIALIAGNGRNAPPLDQGFTNFFFSSIRTLSSLIGLEISENFGEMHESALFSVSGLLLFIVLFVSVILGILINVRWNQFFIFSKIKTFINQQNYKINSFPIINKITSFWYLFSYFLRWFALIFCFLVVYTMFFWILGDIFYKGIANFQFKYLADTQGESGLLSVILSSLILILTATLISFPFAFIISIFLVFYGKKNVFMQKVKVFINAFIYQFSSAPTIIFGMFGLTLFVSYLNFGFSILAAGLTMILIILPVMIQVIKQNLESFPRGQYESAIALGLNKRTVILKLVCPNVFLGLLVSLIFGVNKIIAESSPILITMGTSNQFPKRGVFSGGRTFSTHIYSLQAENLSSNTENIVYQTAFLTLCLLLILNFLTFWLLQKNKKAQKE